MKSAIKLILVIIIMGSIASVAWADWYMSEIKNESSTIYKVLGKDLQNDWEKQGMTSFGATDLGDIEPGQTLAVDPEYGKYTNSGREFPYLLLQPATSIKGKMRNIRVYFPPMQSGVISPRSKEKPKERMERFGQYARLRLSRSSTSDTSDFYQDKLDTSKKTLILLSATPHISFEEQATLLTIEPEKDIFLTIKKDDNGYQLFGNDIKKYRVSPQTGPAGGRLGRTERLLPLKNNVKDGDISIDNKYVISEANLGDVESSTSSESPKEQKRFNFDLWNKTDKTIYFEIGTEDNPPRGIEMRKLSPFGKESEARKMFVIRALTTDAAASQYFGHQSTQVTEMNFKPNARGNAYMGVKINPNGMPSFYDVGAQRRVSPRPSSKLKLSPRTPEDSPAFSRPGASSTRREIRLRSPIVIKKKSPRSSRPESEIIRSPRPARSIQELFTTKSVPSSPAGSPESSPRLPRRRISPRLRRSPRLPRMSRSSQIEEPVSNGSSPDQSTCEMCEEDN